MCFFLKWAIAFNLVLNDFEPKALQSIPKALQATNVCFMLMPCSRLAKMNWRSSVAANFEVTAALKLAAGEILNFGSFEVTYVTSKLHGHFVPKY